MDNNNIWDDRYTITLDDDTIYTSDVDISTSIIPSLDFGEYTLNPHRVDLRNNGTIPIDIWAKLYNNNNIGNDDDEFYI
jgi:hypothetical protein